MEDVAIVLVLLVLSFTFSGAEVAFFSLPASRLPALPFKESQWVASLLAFPNRLLSTILLGNTAVNSFAASVFTLLFDRVTVPLGLDPATQALVDVLVFTSIVLLFGEITPKTLAFHRPLTFVRLAVYLLYPFSILLRPLTLPLGKMLEVLTQKLRLQAPKGSPFLELERVLRAAQEMRAIGKGEAALFRDLFQLARLTAWDIMTPREEVKALPQEAKVRDALALFHRTRYAKFPVYRASSLDQVVGVFDVLVVPEKNLDPDLPIRDHLKPPLFVLEHTGLLDLYLRLRAHDPQMALVVDEFGSVMGVVTMHDLVKGVLGTLQVSGGEPLLVKQIGPNTWILWGDYPLWELEELLGLPVDQEGPATLAGLIMERLGRVPQEGERITWGEFLFEVLEVEGSRVGAVKVRRIGR